MVSLEFEKPSSWSFGKWIGIIAVLLLIIGPFLPYLVSETKIGDIESTDSITYFDYDVWGLFMFLPLFSAILIIILLYFKFNIYFENNSTRMKINHFIMMIWGFWFFLTYLTEGLRHGDESSFWTVYAGYGLWMIAIGFLLCAVAGFFEWQFPTTAVPKVGIGKKKEAVVKEVSAEKAPPLAAPIEPEKVEPVPAVKEEPRIEKKAAEPEPAPAKTAKAEKIEAVDREPTTEEEKTLLRWARHINEDGKTFEQCMKCKNYVFIIAEDSGKAIAFKCPDCGASFTLKK